MAIPTNTFDIPLRDKVTETSLMLTRPWEWFFRSVWERLYPLGVEKSFQVPPGVHTRTFPSTLVSVSTDTFSVTQHGYSTGQKCRLGSLGTLPTGLASNVDYYVIKVSDNIFKLATSVFNANAGIAVNITGAGSGDIILVPYMVLLGMKFDSKALTQATVDFLIQRVTTGTGAASLVESGFFIVTYNPGNGITPSGWKINLVQTSVPDDSGLDFTITTEGQVEYTLAPLTGTSSILNLFWRARTLGGKNQKFSDMGRR